MALCKLWDKLFISILIELIFLNKNQGGMVLNPGDHLEIQNGLQDGRGNQSFYHDLYFIYAIIIPLGSHYKFSNTMSSLQ